MVDRLEPKHQFRKRNFQNRSALGLKYIIFRALVHSRNPSKFKKKWAHFHCEFEHENCINRKPEITFLVLFVVLFGTLMPTLAL